VRTLATWSVRHRWRVVVLWLIALVVATALARSVGSNYSNGFSLPGQPSTAATNLLKAASPAVSGDSEEVVFETSGGVHVSDPDVEARVEATLGRLARVPHVTNIVSPYEAAGTGHVSKDGTVAFATVTFDEQAGDIGTSLSKQFVDAAQAGDQTNLKVAVAGEVAENANPPSLGGAGFGIILAAIVLFVVFGSLLATALPLIAALASLGTAIGIIELVSHALPMPNFSSELTLLIGLGVGVDYALFIVTRHRQGLLAGKDVESSIVTALNTSGRAVLFAGITVCIALLGMFALGVSLLDGLAIGAAIGVASTMLAALTLLPALLGFIGPRVLSRRQRRRLAAGGPLDTATLPEGFWSRWAAFVRRRPVVPTVVALTVIVVLALPFFSIRLGSSDAGNDPSGTTTRTAYEMLAKGFGPGFNGPLQLVAEIDRSAEPHVVARLVHDVSVEPGVAGVSQPVALPVKDDKDVVLVNVYPTTSPQDAATTSLIHHLRDVVIPRATARTGVNVYVGGSTAIFVDFDHVISQKLPLFIGVVVLLSFLLLSIVFRSLLIPLTGAVMNLLSIGAALGILTAVFQKGWLGGLIGTGGPGPIEAFLPVMLFAILFGLSMDYQVFLVTRMHEEWQRTHDNSAAVQNGLAATGKTITAAALIMILVFGSFIFGGERILKEFGLGLAGGVLVDAVFIRMAVVPAVMQMFGRANWWFPPWADRVLPHVSVEPGTDDISEPRDAALLEAVIGAQQ
jgi:putative drug exporter of the RND superfamily